MVSDKQGMLHGCPVNVGDRVWHIRYGWCYVRDIGSNGVLLVNSPISGFIGEYNWDGRFTEPPHEMPELFWQPIDVKCPSKPEPEINWSKVPQGTWVIIERSSSVMQFVAYCELPDVKKPFVVMDKFTSGKKFLTSFESIRLAPGVEVKEEWLK